MKIKILGITFTKKILKVILVPITGIWIGALWVHFTTPSWYGFAGFITLGIISAIFTIMIIDNGFEHNWKDDED